MSKNFYLATCRTCAGPLYFILLLKHLKVSKICILMSCFWPNYIILDLKSTEELSFMTLENGAKFEEKFAYQFKTDMRNLTNFGPSTQKSQIFFPLMDSFSPKYIILEFRKYTGLCLMALKIDANFKENWLVLPKMTWGIWQIFTRVVECLKVGTLMGSFCPK